MNYDLPPSERQCYFSLSLPFQKEIGREKTSVDSSKGGK